MENNSEQQTYAHHAPGVLCLEENIDRAPLAAAAWVSGFWLWLACNYQASSIKLPATTYVLRYSRASAPKSTFLLSCRAPAASLCQARSTGKLT